MPDTVIRIEHITKEYRLGVISHRTLYRDVQSLVSRILNKEDPNSLIGSDRKRTRGGKFHALDDVTLEIKQGEVVGIIGKNGAGKSTLLKIISRVTTPTKGEVKIRGRIASLLEVGTGFHPELTGKDNIYLNGAILGMNKKEINSKYDEIVAFSGIEEFIGTPVKRYSSGMYVRLAFAVAAHLEPEILIVDEVLAVGDIEFQKKCMGKMSDVSKSGRTILFVSHNMGAIRSLCTTAIYLEKGQLKASGNPGILINTYNQSFNKNEFNEFAELSNANNRRGSGEARFSSIKLYNGKGVKTETFYDDDDIIIEFIIKINKPVNILNFHLAIRSPIYGDCITTTPFLSLIDSKKLEGDIVKAKLYIKKPNIRAGEYPLFLWLGSNENLYYDAVDSIYYLNIISDKTEDDLGYNPDYPNGYFNIDYSISKL
jgi:lipopolysaccharide transport system ATP-binding protein